jgi:hypothetical protein
VKSPSIKELVRSTRILSSLWDMFQLPWSHGAMLHSRDTSHWIIYLQPNKTTRLVQTEPSLFCLPHYNCYTFSPPAEEGYSWSKRPACSSRMRVSVDLGDKRQQRGGAICNICGGTHAQMFKCHDNTIFEKEWGCNYPVRLSSSEHRRDLPQPKRGFRGAMQLISAGVVLPEPQVR